MTSKSSVQPQNLYGNISVFTLAGELIFYCSAKRASWYLKRNLAKYLDIDHQMLQLQFEPYGKGHSEKPELLDLQKNQCCVCSVKKELHKTALIPKQYILLMESKYKSRRWDNYVLLCHTCSLRWEYHAQNLSKTLSQMLEAPLNGKGDEKDPVLGSAILAAHALLKHREKMPQSAIDRCCDQVAAFLKHPFTQKDLQKLIETPWHDRSNYQSHAQIVMKRIIDVPKFQEMWRHWFVQSMSPQYLPAHLKYLVGKSILKLFEVTYNNAKY